MGVRLGTLGGVAGLMLACGGSSDTGLAASGGSGGSGAGTTGGAGGASGSAGAAGSGGLSGAAGSAGSGGSAAGPVALDDFCQTWVPKYCASAKSCCEGSGFGHDAAGCTTLLTAQCEADVAAVKASELSYDGSDVHACIAATDGFLNKCVLAIDDLLVGFDSLLTCGGILDGKVPEGGACQRDSQCEASADPAVLVDCNQLTKVCRHSKLLSQNQACQVGDGISEYCAPGLYCDAEFLVGPPYSGICKQATPAGGDCNGVKVINLECGLGFYCNKTSSKCTKAKVGGAPCAQAIECQSFSCVGAQCAAVPPLVNQAVCTG
ncbi:MAG: hypothetical protein KF718_17290 [Polyangiaceae bacterium]|nr:hypothetical protein [Polyangiaceae bacterium]